MADSTTVRAPRRVRAGSVLAGRYRLIRKLGAGGMASVWLAEDERLGREVAVKRMHTEHAEDAARRFAREARLGAALNHSGLVSVFDTVAEDDNVLIVMEYVAGHDLATELEESRIDDDRALQIVDDLAGALDHAHGHRIVHRDVKPSNVLLTRAGRAKLADLGVAKAAEDTAITASGTVLGSVPYMSPEQLSGRPVEEPSDIYSLALLAYEMLAGQRARPSVAPSEIALKVETEGPPDLAALRPDLPPQMAAVICRALERDPSRRYGSAGAFAADLREAMRSPAPASSFLPPPPPREQAARRSSGLAWFAAAAVLLVAAALAAVLLTGGGSSSEPGESGSAGQHASGSGGGGGGGAAAQATGGGAAAPTSDPAAAVRDFYARAAAGDFDGASGVADSNLLAQLGGPDGLASVFSDVERVDFTSLETTSQSSSAATVEFSTVSHRTSVTEQCTGSANLVREGNSWLLDELVGINCS
jgi:serine/threonine protein kinase